MTIGANSGENALTELAAFSVETAVTRVAGQLRGGVAGLVVQPVVWFARGSSPDAADVGIWASGAAGLLGGTLASIPGIVVGMVKAAVDDNIAAKIEEAKLDEEERVRQFMLPCGDYDFWANNNTAQAGLIAQRGGVVWKHPNGAWIFLRDAHNRLICDYTPRNHIRWLRPELPIRSAGNGHVHYRISN